MVLRRNGANPLVHLRDEMDRLMSDFFGPVAGVIVPNRFGASTPGFPAINAWEDGDNLFAEAEVPGMKVEDVEISVIGSDLTIRGRRSEAATEGVAFHRQERPIGEFNRVVRLPVEVNTNRVEATLKDGVLLIKLPKVESAKPKKIEVKPASS